MGGHLKSYLVLALVLVNLVSLNRAAESTTRAPISDDALEKTLSDKRYLTRQLKCALGEAPCDPVGRRLKSRFVTSSHISVE